MARLNSGSLGLVVTTELAARGLDAPILSHVVNLDLPTDATVRSCCAFAFALVLGTAALTLFSH